MAESQFSAQAQRDIKGKLRILAEGAERGNIEASAGNGGAVNGYTKVWTFFGSTGLHVGH
jgi:hypothetical protein